MTPTDDPPIFPPGVVGVIKPWGAQAHFVREDSVEALALGWRPRHLPLASDRDRIAAARYAAEKLAIRLAIIARRRRLLWEHYADSNGAVVSVNA